MLNMKKKLHKQKGFTLIEVLLAITILSILAITFLPIIAGSFQQIVAVGQRSQKLYKAQNRMEISIVDEVVFKSAEIPIIMENSGKTFHIKGGMVEADQLQTFIPWVPTIEILPNRVDEGYSPSHVAVNITGENTNFQTGTSKLTLTNANGYRHTPTLTVINNSQARFNLPREVNRLTNAGGEYIVTITTGNEVVRAKLNVSLPGFVTILGNTTLEVSNHIIHREASFNNAGQIRNVFWQDNRFFALGKHATLNEGVLFTLEEGQTWHKKTMNTSNGLNALAYNGNRFVAVGDHATIITSTDGNSWTKVKDGNIPADAFNRNINAITWGTVFKNDGTAKNLFVAVGDKYMDPRILEGDEVPNHDFGIILVSEDGLQWEKVAFNVGSTEDSAFKNLKDITYSKEAFDTKFVAVGEGGTILASENGVDWSVPNVSSNPGNHLNSIIFSKDQFIAVGNGGTIFTSQEGETWNRRTAGTTKSLHDIAWGGVEGELKYTAVGNGVILTSSDGNTWSVSNNSSNLTGIVSRR